MPQFTPIKPEAMNTLITYLPFFREPEEDLYIYNGEHALEPYSYPAKVNEFVNALYEGNFIQHFEWKDWEGEAQQYMDNPAAIQQADWEDLMQLLIYHIRKERFEPGHMKEVLEQNQFLHIIERMEELR